jgi:lipopolysaccharide export system protein LptA
MRRLRPLLLLAIVVILAGVGTLYYTRRGEQTRNAPPVPQALPPETSSMATGWSYSKQNEKGLDVWKISARSFKQLKNPAQVLLEEVELRILNEDGAAFDRFRTREAAFDTSQGTLRAEGDVEITTGEPVEGHPRGRQVFIKTSGLTCESRTGRTYTDRPATFRFEHGEGKSVGASYDPNYRELQLRSQAEVVWRGTSKDAVPLKVEAGELIYKERDSAIILAPWSRLTRAGLVVEAGRGVVWLKEGNIRRVEAVSARGVDRLEPGREIEYAAGQIYIDFGAGGEVEKITGERDARVRSTDKSARTTVTANHVELDFDLTTGASQLRRTRAAGQAAAESVPLAAAGAPRAPTRVLRSDTMELLMQPGGRDIQSVRTQAPGVIEFLPNQPGQPRRRLEGDRISIDYGPENRIRSLEATGAVTRTEPPGAAGKPVPPATLTRSRQLRADFDPAAGELSRLEQWGDFRYEQGDRRGRAERAVLLSGENLIRLSGEARLWDPTGSLAADRMVMNQDTGDVTAEGNVASTREPEPAGKPPAVLSAGDPLHARARRMQTAGGRRLIRYEGDVMLWQGGDRIEADFVEINRGEGTLLARGNVRSQFFERADKARKRTSAVTTLIRAPQLLYSDKTRTARYTGGVSLIRGGLQVTAAELRGVFATKDGSSELETAYADGEVRIEQSAPGRTRKASGEQAEYTVAEGKVDLAGAPAEFIDSLRGSSRGRKLTWFADSDRLLVEGSEAQPAVSRILKK